LGSYCMVFITADSSNTAKSISGMLLKKRLAACVSTVARVKSSFWWKGKIEKAAEVLLTAKTKNTLMPDIIREVKKIHPYEVPEIISIGIKSSNLDYLKWIEKETKK